LEIQNNCVSKTASSSFIISSSNINQCNKNFSNYALVNRLKVTCKYVNTVYILVFSLSALTLLIGRRRAYGPSNIERRGAGVVICLEQSADDLHMVQLMPLPIVSCFIKIQNGSAFVVLFLVPAYLGCPEKEAIKWV